VEPQERPWGRLHTLAPARTGSVAEPAMTVFLRFTHPRLVDLTPSRALRGGWRSREVLQYGFEPG